MEAMSGAQLSQAIRQKAGEFQKLCEGVEEATASRAPEGRWSPKEIVSHLCGAESHGFMATVKTVLEQETPEVDLHPGETQFSEKRARMSFAQLLQEFDRGYGALADLVSGLTPQQLARKARVQALKETPIGEYPTLAVFLQGVAESHLSYHIDHMREILQALGKEKKA
jgi:hypothetical protein